LQLGARRRQIPSFSLRLRVSAAGPAAPCPSGVRDWKAGFTTSARTPYRFPAGRYRAAWNRDAIEEGVALVTAAIARGAPGAYQLQAAIAAVHVEASTAADTDWAEILELYGLLQRLEDNPMVALNHTIAYAMVHGPEAGLERLKTFGADPRLQSHHRVHAVRGSLLERQAIVRVRCKPSSRRPR
jgi:hypothetical protein